MLQCHTLKSICSTARRGQLEFLRNYKTLSYSSRSESEEADLEAARAWFRGFNESTIPTKISTTTGSKSGGSGGQHANKTDSKATTTWDFDTLTRYVPKVLHEGLRNSRYYARRSNAMSIQCDSQRSKHKNTRETWKRLSDEITRVYKERVPGAPDPEQKRRVEEL
ncbi:Peptidyl tRNA hydrolase 4 [Lachnellula willkommii]|uniref:Peptidyl tRNA hydrolase 4 n=1 Tax=Lachnellula willkommii TaxID=215461 RepID=A0A559M1C2_9HELO|nr:Peptidyl tRNA hydrolase 4 [Lachnellula willkommii]